MAAGSIEAIRVFAELAICHLEFVRGGVYYHPSEQALLAGAPAGNATRLLVFESKML